MKPTLIPVLALGAFLALVPLAPRASARSAPQQGGLKRLAPGPQDSQPLDDLFARDFDGARWKERLSDADLARREASYEGLLRRARLDPVARAFLEELARDASGGETAWTARLALRELGRARFSLHGPAGTAPLGHAPFGLEPFAGDPFRRMQEVMDQILEQDALGLLPHGKQRAPSGAPSGSGGQSSRRSVRVEQGLDGARVLITEDVAGEEQSRLYEGQNLAEILEGNPELEASLHALHLQVSAGSVVDLEFELDGMGESGARGRLGRDLGLSLRPQELSRPVVTDRLGVIVQPAPAERALELEGRGLLVERTLPETLANLLGVKAGDILLELQGVPLRSGEDIDRVMRGRSAKEPLTLVWLDELGQRKKKTWPQPDKDER